MILIQFKINLLSFFHSFIAHFALIGVIFILIIPFGWPGILVIAVIIIIIPYTSISRQN
jgi:hypothetical protein